MKNRFEKPLLLIGLLALLMLLSSCFQARGAVPTLTNFNAAIFIVDPNAVPTNVIQLRLDSRSFYISNDGISLSNVFGGTNIFFYNIITNLTVISNIFLTETYVTITNVTQEINNTTNYFTNVFQTFEFVTNIVNNTFQEFNSVTNFFTNVIQEFTYVTNIFTNVYQTFNYVTNYSTNIYQEFVTITNVFKNSTIIFTNNTQIYYSNAATAPLTFLFTDANSQVIGVNLNPLPGVTITGVTNIGGNYVPGSNVTMSTNGTEVTINAASGASGADPTASVGLSVVNGSAPTFLRSDGAPPLSQAITPTWTESHRYTKNVFALRSTGASTYLDANFPSPTNLVSAAIAITHATNGVDHQESVIVWTLNSDGGGDRALTLPLQSSGVNGWLTNKAQTFPTVVTNDTTVVLYGRFKGATDTLAKQTNFMLLGVEYY